MTCTAMFSLTTRLISPKLPRHNPFRTVRRGMPSTTASTVFETASSPMWRRSRSLILNVHTSVDFAFLLPMGPPFHPLPPPMLHHFRHGPPHRISRGTQHTASPKRFNGLPSESKVHPKVDKP